MRFDLPPDTFRLVSSCLTAHEIWVRLKELYSGDVDLLHSLQTTILSEFGSFEPKLDESVNQTVTHFNHSLSRMIKHKLDREVIEQKVTFLNGLRSKWKLIF